VVDFDPAGTAGRRASSGQKFAQTPAAVTCRK